MNDDASSDSVTFGLDTQELVITLESLYREAQVQQGGDGDESDQDGLNCGGRTAEIQTGTADTIPALSNQFGPNTLELVGILEDLHNDDDAEKEEEEEEEEDGGEDGVCVCVSVCAAKDEERGKRRCTSCAVKSSLSIVSKTVTDS